MISESMKRFTNLIWNYLSAVNVKEHLMKVGSWMPIVKPTTPHILMWTLDQTFQQQDILVKHIKICHVCHHDKTCILLHEDSDHCKYGDMWERYKCMYKHENIETGDVMTLKVMKRK